MNPRSEPLLWLQLIAVGAIPLELLLLVLLLAGADPGPLPALERLLVWGLGALAPALLLWQSPADCCSLLLVQVPAAGRTPLQRHLNALQQGWPPRILLILGSALLLAMLWIVDTRAAQAAPLSPLEGAGRLPTLMLAIPLLTLLLWQWQQLGQALWLLSRSPKQVEQAGGISREQAKAGLLSLGLPLLLLQPLQGASPESPPESTAAAAVAVSVTVAVDPVAVDPVAVEPEEATEHDQGSDLDQQVD